MHKIRDWLYVASFPEASSKALLKEYKIEAMLQLFEAIDHPKLKTLFIPVVDGYPITPEQVKQGIDFIRQQRAADKRLMMTCGAGVSRSVTFAMIALKEMEGLTLKQAYSQIHQKHKEALPDQSHWDSVSKYYGEEAVFWEVWREVVMEAEDED